MKLRVMEKMKDSLPGPRYKLQGKGSGEAFREDYLIPAFNKAIENKEILYVDMDGAKYGYPTSFLEEAFGGLARKCGTELVQKTIRIESTGEPMLVKEIMHYIKFAEEERTPPYELSGDGE